MESKEIVCFGEMLWDLLPSGKVPGGAPMNVAIHLAYAGFSPAIISRVGHDTLGMELVTFLQSKNVATHYVQTDQAQPTGVVEVNVADKSDVTYEIVAPVAWDFIQLEEEAGQAVKEAKAFIYGTLAARQEVSRQTLLQLLPFAKYKVLDVNFRAPHYSQTTTEELLHSAHLVKMNHHELAEISGWHGASSDEKESMAFLARNYAIEVLIVTRGANGAIIFENGKFTEHPGFPVEVEDTIGSGDSFLATFLSLFLEDKPVAEALKKACLVGALVATHHGATPQITAEEIAALEARQP